MRSMSPTAGEAAISPGPGTRILVVPDLGPNPGSGTGDWFYDCAVAVFGESDTGRQLHLATGWARTSCYEFVARDPDRRRRPSPEFLRILLRSDHGRPFFNALMHGSDAAWWDDLQNCERRAADAERFVREFR